MRIVLLGPPGSGKGPLSEKIAEQYGVAVISVSSILDTAAAETSELGRLAKEAKDAARVSDELLSALCRIQLPRIGLESGFVLVDMPRNAGQADVLDEMLNAFGRPLDLVLNLEVDPDELMERLVGRISCDNCGAQYNMYINPPMVDGVCDECGARVIRRPDDYEETISNRLRVYEGQMGPLLQYYEINGKLKRIDGNTDGDGVWKRVRKVIDATPMQEPEPIAAVEPEPVPATPGSEDAAVAKVAAAVAKAAAGSHKKAAAGKKAARKGRTTKAVAGALTEAGSAAQAGGRKSTVKKAGTAKAAAKKKTASKKAVAKKAAVKKAAVKKAAAKKASGKKTTAKKKVVKKAVAGKAAAKRAAPSRKVVVRKAAKKTVAKKVAVGKKVSKRPTAKKPAVKKTVAKKATTKKKVVKKATTRKSTPKKTITRKTAPKKATTKKAAVKKTAARKTAKKKSARR